MIKDQENLPLILSVPHTQEITQISSQKVYELTHFKGFPAIRLGKIIRIPRQAFFKWLTEQTEGKNGAQ